MAQVLVPKNLDSLIERNHSQWPIPAQVEFVVTRKAFSRPGISAGKNVQESHSLCPTKTHNRSQFVDQVQNINGVPLAVVPYVHLTPGKPDPSPPPPPVSNKICRVEMETPVGVAASVCSVDTPINRTMKIKRSVILSGLFMPEC